MSTVDQVSTIQASVDTDATTKVRQLMTSSGTDLDAVVNTLEARRRELQVLMLDEADQQVRGQVGRMENWLAQASLSVRNYRDGLLRAAQQLAEFNRDATALVQSVPPVGGI